MKLRKEEEKTVNFYNQHAQEWVSTHISGSFWDKQIEKFHSLLHSGKILEIGSGGGRDASQLLRLGYDYLGTDISEGLLQEAKKFNPEAKFLEKSVYDLDFEESSFDGFWAAAVLLHIPKERIDEALSNIHRVVKNDGIGFIAIKKGEGEKVEKEGRFFAYYSQEEFADKLKNNNFKIIDSETRPVSENTTWLIYFVKNIK